MQETSALYKELWAGEHVVETRLDIAGMSYFDDDLKSMKTVGGVIKKDALEIGCVISRTIELSIFKSSLRYEIPPMAKLEPWIRLSDGSRQSEWIPKGKFYTDTREGEEHGLTTDLLKVKGYDDLLKAEQPCPLSGLDWPAADIQVVRRIASQLGVPVDPRTEAIMVNGYPIEAPADYASREVLSGIGVMYGGSWIMSDAGALLLVQLCGIPEGGKYLVDHNYNDITMGGVRILV